MVFDFVPDGLFSAFGNNASLLYTSSIFCVSSLPCGFVGFFALRGV